MTQNRNNPRKSDKGFRGLFYLYDEGRLVQVRQWCLHVLRYIEMTKWAKRVICGYRGRGWVFLLTIESLMTMNKKDKDTALFTSRTCLHAREVTYFTIVPDGCLHPGCTNCPCFAVCLPYCIANCGQWCRHLRHSVHFSFTHTGWPSLHSMACSGQWWAHRLQPMHLSSMTRKCEVLRWLS